MQPGIRSEDAVIRLISTQQEWQEAEGLFLAVAREKHWIVPENLSAYDPQSRRWVLTRNGILTGALQLTIDGDHGLPFESVWPELAYQKRSFSACGEIVWLIMNPSAPRHHSDFLSLSREMFRFCGQTGIPYLFTCVTERRRRQYVRCGCPLTILGPERLHWGYPSFPLGVDVAAVNTVS
jgi:hypothetical protein